jgi:hypothetical protein
MDKLSESLKGVAASEPTKPVWDGPEEKGPNGGITFSLLCRFLCCRERFRLRAVEGVKPKDVFSHRIEYGNMWHVCEEALARSNSWPSAQKELLYYTQELIKKYPLNAQQIDHWYNVCKVQFPVYVDYWSQHPDVKDRMPLFQEQVFDVPYELPSGRTVRLRGKWDSVDLIGKGKDAGVYLQENKTKGDVDEVQLRRQLTFDLQTMMYLVALTNKENGIESYVNNSVHPIKGVRYNVVRRPLSGGEGSIVQKQGSKNVPAETKEQFYSRVRGVIDGTGLKQNGERYAGPSYWFVRWKTEIGSRDLEKFKRTCLNPILENLCWWWDEMNGNSNHIDPNGGGLDSFYPAPSTHWRHPFGVYNVLDEGGATDLDQYLEDGNDTGLVRGSPLFEELAEGIPTVGGR